MVGLQQVRALADHARLQAEGYQLLMEAPRRRWPQRRVVLEAQRRQRAGQLDDLNQRQPGLVPQSPRER